VDNGCTPDAPLELGGFGEDAVDGKLAGRAVRHAKPLICINRMGQ
jgi:hypothetical protein